MEKILDFDQWYLNWKPPVIEYVAVFDSQTGAVLSVGPSHAFVDEKYKVPIDKETAESIISAEIKIDSCVIDINSNKLEVAEIKSVFKLDNVLHRIISIEYTDQKNSDIYLTYNSKNKSLKIELSTEFGGTKVPVVPVKKRRIVWDGDTEMNFFITDYNDPNVLFEIISVRIKDLAGKAKTFKNIKYKKFSVYTRRLFKNYVIVYR
jgi:hypothetical protein